MAHVTAKDGTRIYVEETGSGHPILFLHEFAGDHRSWAPQVARFSRTHRCVVMAARGYPPSDVSDDAAAYGHDIAADDAVAVLDGLRLARAHVVGLSMGAYTGLMLAIRCPERLAALVAAAGGSGSHPKGSTAYRVETEKRAAAMLAAGKFPADEVGNGPTRVQLKRKNPSAWKEFRDQAAEHPVIGSAHVLRRIVGGRPSLYTFENALKRVSVPTLLMVGDEDDGIVEINVWLKRTMPAAGLDVWPASGHLLNLEEPEVFNDRVARFLKTVEADAWPTRQPAATARKAG
ncbi:MAG: alpha/beta hydrolase [Rhodospirillales bacterium]|nr:alpha/beta hydrolase [Rhodospirillales bacterium]